MSIEVGSVRVSCRGYVENLGREKRGKKNKTDNKKDPKNTDHTCHRAFSFADPKT